METAYSHVLVCTGAGCIASGALQFSAALRRALAEVGLQDRIQVVETGCLGPCAVGPVAVVYPDGCFYENLSVRETAELLDVPEGTVKSRMYHARRNLAKELA